MLGGNGGGDENNTDWALGLFLGVQECAISESSGGEVGIDALSVDRW